MFFLGNISQENVFYDILERKNAFLGYKNKKFEKSKNGYFFKGVNLWFWSKNDHFSKIFFEAIQARKISFAIFQNEKNHFKATKKNKKLKKSKNRHFSKGFNPWFWFALVQHRVLKVVIIHSKYFPDSDWLKAHFYHNQLLMTEFGRNLTLTRQ